MAMSKGGVSEPWITFLTYVMETGSNLGQSFKELRFKIHCSEKEPSEIIGSSRIVYYLAIIESKIED